MTDLIVEEENVNVWDSDSQAPIFEHHADLLFRELALDEVEFYEETKGSDQDTGSAGTTRIEKEPALTLSQQKAMDHFAKEREMILINMEERKAELQRQRFEEDLQLKQEVETNLAHLKAKYSHVNVRKLQ
ncbi:hypothetical protein ACET3Z_028563 [Daucus carota]